MKQLDLNSSFDVFPALSDNSTNCKPFAQDTQTIKAFKILAYSIVLITSLFGNVVIVATVARNRRMRTTINFLIANMAASDLLISTFAVPIKLSEIVAGPRRWLIHGPFGLILCKLAYFFQDISQAVSIMSLVVIAIDRYRGIVFPFRPAIMTPKRCKFVIPLIWLSGTAVHGVYFYMARLDYLQNDGAFCILTWAPKFDPKKTQERYTVAVLALLVVLPFSILTVLYSQIIWVLRKERVASSFSSPILCKRHKENTKVIKNVCAVMIAFAFCVLPMSVYGFLLVFVWKWEMPCNMEQFGFAVHFVLFSNAAVTPLIYFVFNEKYRKGVKDILRGLCVWYNHDIGQDMELNDWQSHQHR